MDQKYIDLYDEYTHAPLERRVFLNRLAGLAGSMAAAQALLPALEVNYAHAAVISEDDARLVNEYITYPIAGGTMRAYLAKPAGAGRHPAVLVIHENRGLNAHIEDVARRAAAAGFLALAPDALSPLGGTPADTDQARSMFGQLDYDQTVQNFVSGVSFLAAHPEGTGKVGSVGFCWGGAMSGQLAVHSPGLNAAVVFYGGQPAAEDVGEIEAPLLLHYAGLDTRINAGIPAFEEALKANEVDYTLHIYEGVNHAFHNDTGGTRYDEAAATLAWQRTVDFFREKLA